MRAHEAGALHADGYGRPSWLAVPGDVNDLVPSLWAGSVELGADVDHAHAALSKRFQKLGESRLAARAAGMPKLTDLELLGQLGEAAPVIVLHVRGNQHIDAGNAHAPQQRRHGGAAAARRPAVHDGHQPYNDLTYEPW